VIVVALLQDAESTNRLVQAAAPWAKLYSHSKSVSTAVLFLHLVPLLLAGGTALVADRATLRAARSGAAERTRQLGELAMTHRLVVGGLALSFVSGLLLFLSDVETFLVSPLFWIKLALVALLLTNGYLMTRTEVGLARAGDDPRLWARMRVIAMTSFALWIATTLAGVVLTQFA
jgi:hypothetical protein